MPINLIQSPLLLFVLLSLCLLLLFILLWVLVNSTLKTKHYHSALKASQKNLDETQKKLYEEQQGLNEQFRRHQELLFQQIIQEREKQLTSFSQLRVELEQQFSQSSSSLVGNIQEFKVHMVERFEQLQRSIGNSLADGQQQQSVNLNIFGEKNNQAMQQHQQQTQTIIVDNIRKSMHDFRQDFDRNVASQNEFLNKTISGLTETTDNRLKDISGQVEKRLNEGFEKTTKTFNDVLKRLALIDDAQKKITELSSNVVSLQEILNDKRSRGAFGEVQLESLVSNIMPKSHYSMQKTLSNQKIADCLLLMPEPTGKIAIDAKFPLESYKKMNDIQLAQSDRERAGKQFVQDIKKHIKAISDKYILPPETSDGAVMFIPAESIFAEIHGHHPELIEYAYQHKVWMVSPTTLMAILTTASTVIKDEQTRKQVHVIQEHLGALGKDFVRFQSRMETLSKHIGQVSNDVNDVNISARKISTRFTKIEKVDLSLDEEKQEPSLTVLSSVPRNSD